MKKEVGLWIDDQKAVIVILTMKSEIIRRVESGVDQAAKISTGTTKNISSTEIARQQRANLMDTYFKRVVTNIQDAGSILIFGPGNAKGELEKEMERAGLEEQIVDIETADQMSDRQILAKVHRYFPNNRRSIFLVEEFPLDNPDPNF